MKEEARARIANFWEEHQLDIVLAVGVILISLLSFALGFIIAKTQEKESIKIEEISVNFPSVR
ncbi:MAG: hypothetical protein GF370_02615 [Candidatus Nealsonbacteria bacterium]|nr:hypothetical protein [Candidatus Nealsonbacteria bacterium]